MTTPFPLLRLPRLALIPVFQQMQSKDVIAFSLLSKKAQNLSKIFRKLSSCSVRLIVESDHLYVRIRFKMDRKVELSHYFNTENVPNLANAMVRNSTFTYENCGLSASKWLERILDVANCESICHLDLKGSPQVDVCNSFAALPCIYKLNIFKHCSTSFAKKALEIILPVTREITLLKIPFENREEFQTFLMSNLNYLNINTCYFSMITLDDFLVTNQLKLKLGEVLYSATGVSQFLTNWFHSKRNSRLEHLKLFTIGVINETCLPEVLNAVPFPVNEKRTFRYSKQLGSTSVSFFGGYDIKRTDGKKATIVFSAFHGGTFINFYVWP
ncbi:hypothetical protein GCK72_021259 [Caenorhabditis remanei]|uniref:F-box domain-containing protein n=1 Tax=Caenorhabditis remanei TaxID=31234 RepID=A0A6A5GJE2_CAERE|nr:hypothetical protein GCK72_021259 [Caenorhabditis remanei]KAF1754695.1 hypothetical protein GCK72_021259 [Caenorhabditis remanei]